MQETWTGAPSGGPGDRRPATFKAGRRPSRKSPIGDFEQLVRKIDERSSLLSRYVARYAHDMSAHLASVRPVLARGASVHYIVGNSKFYDVVVPVQNILAAELRALGFESVRVEELRKRTSKPELFEYAVSGRKT